MKIRHAPPDALIDLHPVSNTTQSAQLDGETRSRLCLAQNQSQSLKSQSAEHST